MGTTFRIQIQGRVQGVGFRPFVYREALAFKLGGNVSNNESGVEITVSGPRQSVASFYKKITQEAPAIARVVYHRYEEIPYQSFKRFSIRPSAKNSTLNLQLTPDFALCPDCRQDLNDPANRRFGYPFISCVNCGPRWALTKTFPFEREHTSMQAFKMCDVCAGEYGNPEDRRFHAQTNSCGSCGIKYRITDAKGVPFSVKNEAIFKQLALFLEEGKIIALKNTSGYLLCCDATKPKPIETLRSRKKRPTKPFAVLYPSLEYLESDFSVQPAEGKALRSPERPIVLLDTNGYQGKAVLDTIAPGLHQLGVMLPYTGLLDQLSRAYPKPLIATSGNIHGAPICFSEARAHEKLSGVADYFFEHDLEIIHSQDDSVLRFSRSEAIPILLRRSRGMAPNYSRPVNSANSTGLMALGAELKSTIGFIPNDFLYISEYIGNLENYEVFERFTELITSFTTLFQKRPTALLTDTHPGYHSTRYGKELSEKWNIPCHQIPHHKAHFAAVLGENDLFKSPEPILGVVWDGTGYGEDGQVWGGEFFRFEKGSMVRAGQVAYFDWLAGDAMAKNPRLSLFSLLEEPEFIQDKFSPHAWRLYRQLKSGNTLKTSSMGRLFDAVASLLGLCDLNSYEGEAAMLLEAATRTFETGRASQLVRLDEDGNIPAIRLIGALKNRRISGQPPEQLAGDFIFTLAKLILEKAEREGISRIACSGGVFQNALLVNLLCELNPGSFELFFHRELSPNDENIPFGQLMYHLNCH
ncbi:MAG: carbamoyltransferase HypF [Robiginitalea sp.]|uniref:carbamoyltransferase HypF n=1 Tax=Robiginitalea sp. TaxID=1902411 RepID=UPI003C746249